MPGDAVSNNIAINRSGVYVSGNSLCSMYYGTLDKTESYVRVIPINGRYIPNTGDLVLGKVVSDEGFNYVVSYSGAKNAYISKRSAQKLDVGSVVALNVSDVNEIKDPSFSVLETLPAGELLNISSGIAKLVISSHKSIIDSISNKTSSKITMGYNGIMHISSGDVKSALKLLRQAIFEDLKLGLDDLKSF